MEATGEVTQYSSLRKDEFMQFMESYQKQHKHFLQQEFEKLDSDKSEELDHLELQQLFQAIGIEPMTHVLDEVIAEVDTDGQGTLSFEEFEKAMDIITKRKGFSKSEYLRYLSIFRKFDRDESGEIDTKEFGGILSWLGFSLPKAEIALIVKSVDFDGSGSVSPREFMMCMRKIKEQEVEKVKR